MYPRLLEIPFIGDIPTSWPVFLVLVGVVVALSWVGGSLPKGARMIGRLLVILPPVALLTALVTFVQTPFGKIPINTYGFMIMVGFLLATWVSVRRAKKLDFDTDFILDIGIIGMIFGTLGAKINFVLQDPTGFAEEGKNSIFDFSDGGFLAAGALLGVLPFLFWYLRTRKEEKVPLVHWKNGVLMVFTLLFAVIGARGLYIVNHVGEYNFKVYESWQSGFVLYGGLIAAVAACSVYALMRGVSIPKLAGLGAAPVMLGLAFGRIGCFLNGCCYGTRCHLPWAVSYPRNPIPGDTGHESMAWQQHNKLYDLPHDATHSFSVHPTQLYEVLIALALFFFLSWLWKRTRDRGRGEVFLIMGMGYALWRFVVEYLRDDPGREVSWLPITYSQGISLLAFIVCAVWLFLLFASRKKAAPEAEAPPPEEGKEEAGRKPA
ncbi:MAG: prolipoprotein diacylglyceryl transferase [Planctomycetota bacterium]|jgi:phosphatidylglycerol:prolipoprotein diacylglycerol transferase